MNGMSVTPGLLIEYVRKHHDDAGAAGELAGYLSRLKVPGAAWGELPFATELDERVATVIEERVAKLDRSRRRLSGVPDWLSRAAADYAASDVEATRILRAAAGEYSSDVDSAESVDSHDAVGATADAHAILAEIAATAGLVSLADPPADRESPGSEELMSCRAEHISTLEQAEGLLRQRGLLDFTAPSQYLRQLATVRPGTVGGRVEPLSTLSGYVDGMGARLTADAARLSRQWEGDTAAAFDDSTTGTAEALTDTAADLSWLASETEALWRLLDTLMHDVAEAVWSRVETVGDSRIARIRTAVDLVEDANVLAADTDATVLWGGLSDEEVDAALQVLYKRVWYLANAMTGLVSTARDDAARLFEPGERPPVGE